MVIDVANAFYLPPLEGDTAQAASNILDFGTKEAAARGNMAGNLVVQTTAATGSVKLQESDNKQAWTDLAGSTVTVTGAGTYAIVMPKHKRYLKAVLTTVTASNTAVYIGAVPAEAE